MWTINKKWLKSRWSLVPWIQTDIIESCVHSSVCWEFFLRFLSLTGSVSLSLFREFVLPGCSRDGVSWESVVSERFSVVVETSSSRSAPQQTSGTGKPSRVKVWEWNRGEQANRTLTASWSSRFFFCSAGSSSGSANRQKTHLVQRPEESWTGLKWSWWNKREDAASLLLMLLQPF